MSQLPLFIPKSNLPRLVIIGSGFAGLQLAKKLKNAKYQIVILDKNNFHQFQPLLYMWPPVAWSAMLLSFQRARLYAIIKILFLEWLQYKKFSRKKNVF